VTVQESHDQPPRVRIGMVFPVRQEFTIAVAREKILPTALGHRHPFRGKNKQDQGTKSRSKPL